MNTSAEKIYTFKTKKDYWRFIPLAIPLVMAAVMLIHFPFWWRYLFVQIVLLVPLIIFFVPVYFLFLKGTTLNFLEISKLGIVANGRFLDWHSMQTFKRRNLFGTAYFWVNPGRWKLSSLYFRVTNSDLAALKFAIEACAAEDSPAKKFFKVSVDEQSIEGRHYLANNYDPENTSKSNSFKIAGVMIAMIIFLFLSNNATHYLIKRTSIGQSLMDFATNTTVLKEGDVILGIAWPEGTRVYHQRSTEEITYIETTRAAAFLNGYWPKDTHFSLIEGKLSFAIADGEFKTNEIIFSKGATVGFKDQNISTLYPKGPWKYHGVTYEQVQIYFKNNKPVKFQNFKNHKMINL